MPFSRSVPVPFAPFFPSTPLVSPPLSSLPYNLVPSSVRASDNVSLLSSNNISPSPEVASVLCPSSHPISPIDRSSARYLEPDPKGVSDDESDFESTRANPPTTLGLFFTSLSGDSSRRTLYSEFANLCNSLPSSPTNPYTPLQMAAVWLSEQYTQNPFVQAFVYKKVANKTRPVATTLPEDFRINRLDHPDPLAGLLPLPMHPPKFVPTGRITRDRREAMFVGDDFLTPEEIKLADWILCTHESAFAWDDSERGSFDPEYFAPIEIPHIAHVPWVLRQGPIPRGILTEVTKIIEDKWKSGVYEPSSSSYNSRWFCVFKKDGKSLRLVHSLESLNAVTIRNSAMPPYTDVVAEDFAGRSVYSTLDLYVSFDQRQLHPNSRDLTTFNTPLGAFRLTVLPMGWTNSPAVLQGDITHILRPEIPHWTQPFADDVPIKGP